MLAEQSRSSEKRSNDDCYWLSPPVQVRHGYASLRKSLYLRVCRPLQISSMRNVLKHLRFVA